MTRQVIRPSRSVGRRCSAAAIAIVAILAACSGSDDADTSDPASAAPATTDATTSSPGTTPVTAADATSPPPDTTPATLAEPAPPATEPPEEAPTERTIEHAAGSTVVPADASRIAVMNGGTILPVLLAFNIDVVAAPLPDTDFSSVLVPPDDLVGIESIGFPTANLELLAAVDPDLIIGFDNSIDDFDALSAIAPTVLLAEDLTDWKEATRSIAEVVGLDAEADEAIADWEADAQALAGDLGDDLATEVSVVRSLGSSFRIHTEHHFAGQIIAEVGIARPADQLSGDPEVRRLDLSLEELPRLDADVLFLYGAGSLGSAGEGIDASLEALQASPLWPTLDVAANDRVVIVDPLAWQQGGLPAARIVLDDLRAALVDA